MDVTIIGAGNMGRGIGTRVVAGKHALTILDKDGGKAEQLAKELGGAIGGALLNTIKGDIVIFALPYAAIPAVIKEQSEQLAGKILVDISNPVDFKTFELIPPPGSSGAEEIAESLPPNATLVKAFNTTFAGTLVKGDVDGKKLDVYCASDSAEAGEAVARLAADGGLRGLYVGPLKHARALEGFQLLQMTLQEKLGTNWMSAIKILP